MYRKKMKNKDQQKKKKRMECVKRIAAYMMFRSTSV